MRQIAMLAFVACLCLLTGCIGDGNQKTVTYGATAVLGNGSANSTNMVNVTNSAANVSAVTNTKQPIIPKIEVTGQLNSTVISQAKNKTADLPLNESESYMNLSKSPEQGLAFGNGEYRIILVDITMPVGNSAQCGMFSIRYTDDDAEIEKMIICPWQEHLWISPRAREYRINVLNTAAGYSKNSRWASVIIYS